MPTTVKYRAVALGEASPSKTAATGWSRLLAFTQNPDLLAVTLFSLIGLFIAICLVRFLPLPTDMAAVFAQLG